MLYIHVEHSIQIFNSRQQNNLLIILILYDFMQKNY